METDISFVSENPNEVIGGFKTTANSTMIQESTGRTSSQSRLVKGLK